MGGDALRRAAIVRAQREDVEGIVVDDRHHAVGGEPVGDRGGAAFQDLRHVPDDCGLEPGEERQGSKDRGVAAAPGDDDLRARSDRGLNRLHPHHGDDVPGAVDGLVGERLRWWQGAGAAGLEMRAHGLLRQLGMDRGELEVESVFPGDLAHDVEHEGEAFVRARGARRADDERDLRGDGAGQHDLGVALDRRAREHALAGGERPRPGVGRSGVAADHPRAQFDRLVER